MKTIGLFALSLFVSATALGGQTRKTTPEIRLFTGAQIATGVQRDLYKDSPMGGVQVAAELKPTIHVGGSFGWVPSQNKYVFSNDNVNIYEYNVGMELGLSRTLTGSWLFKPFFGIGGGARTYAYAMAGVPSKTCAAGYGAAGAEFQIANTAFRVEGRDNVFCYQSPLPGVGSETRNDVGIVIGIAYHLR